MVVSVVFGFAQAAAKISGSALKLADGLSKVDHAGNVAIGEAIKVAVSTRMGGKSVFLSGAQSNVGVAILPAPGSAIIVKMTGKAPLLEYDIPRHEVGTGFQTRTRTRKDGSVGVSDTETSPVMHMPDGRWATGPFMAGGSTGRHMFRDGVAEVAPVAPKIFEKGLRVAALRAGFS